MIQITEKELQASANKHRKSLFIVPMLSAENTLKHFTPHLNLDGNLSLNELTGDDVELAPWKDTRGNEDGNYKIQGRTLEIFLGNSANKFNPQKVWGSIYSSKVLKGDNLKNVDIAKSILSFACATMGRALNRVIWSAKRNADGDKTADLFNGIDTITTAEIAKGTIATGKHNYMEVAKITNANGVDIIESIMAEMDDELLETPCKLFAPRTVIDAYKKDYRERYGTVPYNKEFEKYVVEGAENVELVPLASKKNSEFIHITPQSNIHYGCGCGHYPEETLAIAKYSSWALTLEAAMAFGVQIENLAPERLFCAKVAKA